MKPLNENCLFCKHTCALICNRWLHSASSGQPLPGPHDLGGEEEYGDRLTYLSSLKVEGIKKFDLVIIGKAERPRYFRRKSGKDLWFDCHHHHKYLSSFSRLQVDTDTPSLRITPLYSRDRKMGPRAICHKSDLTVLVGLLHECNISLARKKQQKQAFLILAEPKIQHFEVVNHKCAICLCFKNPGYRIAPTFPLQRLFIRLCPLIQ